MKDIYKKTHEHGKERTYTKVFEYSGRKFRICIHTANYSPIEDCDLDVMTPDGTWNLVATHKTTNAPYIGDYYGTYTIEEFSSMCEKCEKSFKDYVKAVY